MGKYDKATRRIKEENEFEKQQKELKRKYNIDDENVIIKERSGLIKFIIKTASSILRVTAAIIIYALAAVGLISLIYPNIREELAVTFSEIYKEFSSML